MHTQHMGKGTEDRRSAKRAMRTSVYRAQSTQAREQRTEIERALSGRNATIGTQARSLSAAREALTLPREGDKVIAVDKIDRVTACNMIDKARNALGACA